MKLHAEIARTLADLDAATEHVEKHWTEHCALREDIDLIASRLIRQCPLAMIVDALGKPGLAKLRRLIDFAQIVDDAQQTTPTRPTEDDTRRPVKQIGGRPSPRKKDNAPTHPKGWESVEA